MDLSTAVTSLKALLVCFLVSSTLLGQTESTHQNKQLCLIHIIKIAGSAFCLFVTLFPGEKKAQANAVPTETAKDHLRLETLLGVSIAFKVLLCLTLFLKQYIEEKPTGKAKEGKCFSFIHYFQFTVL